jgi:hypothetical protein
MNKNVKKLTVQRQTLRQLSGAALRAAFGGTDLTTLGVPDSDARGAASRLDIQGGGGGGQCGTEAPQGDRSHEPNCSRFRLCIG